MSLFWRSVLGLAAALALGLVGSSAIVSLFVEEDEQTLGEQLLTIFDGIAMVAAADVREGRTTAEQLSANYGFPVEEIAGGAEPVFAHVDLETRDATVSAPLTSGRRLRFGPMPELAIGVGGPKFAGALVAWLAFVVFIAAVWFTWPLQRRLGALARTATALGAGVGHETLGARATVAGPKEVRQLAMTFNEMAEQIEELVASRRRLIAEVVHEVRTPLARLNYRVDAVPDEVRQPVLQEVEAISQLLGELSRGVREELARSNKTERVDLRAVLRSIADREGGEMPPQVNAADGVVITMAARRFRRCVANLVRNAVRHADAKVVISAEEVDREVLVTVEDDGAGFMDTIERRGGDSIPSDGLGLGLIIALHAAREAGGSIDVGQSSMGGAHVTVRWPRSVEPNDPAKLIG